MTPKEEYKRHMSALRRVRRSIMNSDDFKKSMQELMTFGSAEFRTSDFDSVKIKWNGVKGEKFGRGDDD